ncbi:MAG: tryptophan synthase subunit alpha, partial [Pyrinomonadaceae bacterium]
MADGPVIQRSSARALRNDCAVKEILQMIGEVRRQTEVPIVL